MLRTAQKVVAAAAVASLCVDSSVPTVEGLKFKETIWLGKLHGQLNNVKNNWSDFSRVNGDQTKAKRLKELEQQLYAVYPTRGKSGLQIQPAPEEGVIFAPGVGECPVGELPEDPTPEEIHQAVDMQNVRDIKRTVLRKVNYKGISLVAFTGGVTEYPGNRIESEGRRTVIVNAANRGAQKGNGVAGDIYIAGGKTQKKERADWLTSQEGLKHGVNCVDTFPSETPCIPTGHARITSGINTWTKTWTGRYDDKTGRRVMEMEVHPKMQVKHVIHTVGPDFREPSNLDLADFTVDQGLADLASAYKSSLDLAMGYHMGLVGFPLISAGVFRERFFYKKDRPQNKQHTDEELANFKEKRGRDLETVPVPLDTVVRGGVQAVKDWIDANEEAGLGSVQEIAFFAFNKKEQNALTSVFNDVFAEI